MTVYYVAPNGGDNAAGSEAAPFKTLGKAREASSVGDSVIVKDGTYILPGVIKPKTNTSWYSETVGGAKLDCKNVTKAFSMEKTGATGVLIDGFEIFGSTGSGIACNETDGCTFTRNHIHDCPDNGIGYNHSDRGTIDGNHIHHCATIGARSGITVLMSENLGGPALPGGYGMRITNNICHHNGRVPGGDKGDSDGNGIILDKLHWLTAAQGTRYNRTSLISGNICYRNSGHGIKAMASTDLTIEYNTCWGNKQIDGGGNTNPWSGEIGFMYSGGNTVRYNICVSTEALGAAFANDSSSTSYANQERPIGGEHDPNSYTGNIFFATAGKIIDTSGGQPAPPEDSYLVQNPKLHDPANGDFALDSGSPALGKAPGGKNIGAWQGATPPPPNPKVSVKTAPVISAADPTSGKPFTLDAAGTYNGTATVASPRIAQTMVDGVWKALDAIATNNLTTLPIVTVETKFALKEDWTGPNGESGVNRSNAITVRPAPIDPEDPSRKTPKYVEGSFVTAQIDSGMVIPATYAEGTLAIAINQVTNNTAPTPPAPWTVVGKIDGSSVGDTCSTTIAYQVADGSTAVTWGTWTGSAGGNKACWQFTDAEVDPSVFAVASSLSGTAVTWPALPTMTAGSLVVYALYSHLAANPFSFPPATGFTERFARTSPSTGIGSGTSGDSGSTLLDAYAGGNVGTLPAAAKRTYGLVSIRGVEDDFTDDPNLTAALRRIGALETKVDGLPERMTAAENTVNDAVTAASDAAAIVTGFDDRLSAVEPRTATLETRQTATETRLTELADAIAALIAGGGGSGAGGGSILDLGDLTRFLRKGETE